MFIATIERIGLVPLPWANSLRWLAPGPRCQLPQSTYEKPMLCFRYFLPVHWRSREETRPSMTDESLDPEDQARLTSRFGRAFVAGELLFSDGDPGSEAYLLQEGRIRLIKRVGVMERSLRLLRPGDLFGETALLPGAPRSSTAVAVTNGSVLVIEQLTLSQITALHPAVGVRIMQQLVRRLRDAEDQIEVLMLTDHRAKVIVTLLKLAQQTPGASTGPTEVHAVELTISPLELATRVGLDLQSVKNTVQELKDSGHLRINGERVSIPNLGSLRELTSLLLLRDQIVGQSREATGHHDVSQMR